MNVSKHGSERFCFKHGGFAKTKDFRPLPGEKRREICADCYAKFMAKNPVMLGDVPASEIPF